MALLDGVVMRRTHTCGELGAEDVGQPTLLQGWVQSARDHGGLIFIDLRDRYGVTQVVANPERSEDAHRVASGCRSEFVVEVLGTVTARPPGTVNPNLATGTIEVLADSLTVLNPSLPLPFSIEDDGRVDESLRLEYRYLDLRRPRMTFNLEQRHRIVKFIRDFLDARHFLEVETPILMKSTPEGARDYLVPSRLYHGQFYALPQSPQQLKQLLMVAGIDRYFQIARCFRDEDQRADRQPEFTQLDLEMSFVDREDILELVESLFAEMSVALTSKQVATPFRRLSYDEAMARYGSDKPDLRFGMEIADLSDVFQETEFSVFRSVLASGGCIRALAAPGAAAFSRRQIDELTDVARTFGARGLAWAAFSGEEVRSSFARFLNAGEISALRERTGAGEGSLVLVVADRPEVAANVLGRLRAQLGAQLGLIRSDALAYAWILDFPWFERDASTGQLTFIHHPFTAPVDEDAEQIETEPLTVRAKAYDLVLNGYELGGGSIRIHGRELQSRIFRALGYDESAIETNFGHLLRAFQFGAPPHGGIAVGVDRLAMLLSDEENIREVIAFPKNQSARDLMLDAPSPVDERQLHELHLRVEPKPES